MTSHQVAEFSPTQRSSNQLDDGHQFVSFLLERQLLGVPVALVQEVLNPQPIAPVPRGRREVAGLINLRGQIVTALDLRRRLDMPPRVGHSESMNVVVRHLGESYSLLVDEVGDVIDVGPQKPVRTPPTLTQRWKDVTAGIFRLETQLLLVLNLNHLLNLE